MSDNESKKRTPPYVSYKTFKNAITQLEHVPSTIDYSVYESMNGTTRTLLFGALRYLGLIDDKGKPSAEFKAMAEGDDGAWKATMKSLIEKHYAAQLDPLAKGTPKALKDSFPDDLGASVPGPACQFLVKAAEEAGLTVSPSIKKGKFASGGRRSSSRRSTKKNEVDGGGGEPSPSDDSSTVSFPLPLTGGREARLVVPRDLTPRDVAMLKAGMALAEAMASSNTNEDSGKGQSGDE
ncbi:MAG: hypothetical protein AAGD00_10195 [Planctomycetota bacterium]